MDKNGRVFLFGLVALLFAAPVAALSGTAIEAAHDTGCASRSHIQPARLNIDLIPERYGLIPPCQASLELYTPHTTPLRVIDGLVVVTDADGVVLSERAVVMELSLSGGGMRTARVAVGSIANHRCRSLSARLEVRRCMGEAGETIDCPEIRVKRPEAFEELSVKGEELSICLAD